MTTSVMFQNVLEARQLMPTPLMMLSQHATTEPALQDVVLVGAADAAMTMDRALRMAVYCILVVFLGGEG